MDSNDFSWLPSLDLDEPFVVGAKYYIRDGNAWELYEYKGYDPNHKVWLDDPNDTTYPVHIFKTQNGTSYKSVPYIEDLVSRDLIKPYEEDFDVYQNFKIQKVNINDIKSDFVILFKNGISIEETYNLQNELLKRGYSWYSKGKRLLTTDDVSGLIFTIECLNWDTSNPLYKGMNSTFGDRKILMLSTFDNISSESEKQRRLNLIQDHPKVKVIDGDNLLSKI